MQNLINWFEIPADDLERAVAFYKHVFGFEFFTQEMGDATMAFFPENEFNAAGAIVKHPMYKPSSDGIAIYFNGGDDLQPFIDKVVEAGGHILMPKTQISPEIGCFALFLDSEGNRLAFHSRN